jgi:uncharacterized membrane protein
MLGVFCVFIVPNSFLVSVLVVVVALLRLRRSGESGKSVEEQKSLCRESQENE